MTVYVPFGNVVELRVTVEVPLPQIEVALAADVSAYVGHV